MTNTKNTKRALLGSVLALLLCVSMLVGTTFAWFTDSVTSAGNKIQAGTLDVDLFMWNGTAETDRVEITNESDSIFDIAAKAQNSAETLWEPGKTQVVYLSIKNNGTLDLKYKVALNVKDADAEQNLYEVMKYAIKNDAKHGTVDTWDGTNANSVVPGINTTQANDVALGAGQEHFFALSVHMEESAGNKYQGGQVDFDIKVLAAQLASESDSFDATYDELATYLGTGAGKFANDNEAAIEIPVLDTEEEKVGSLTVNRNSVADLTKKVVATMEESSYVGNFTVANGSTAVAYDVKVSNIKENNTEPIKVIIKIPTGLNDNSGSMKLYHYNDEIDFTYQHSTGYIVFETNSFSPFTVVYDPTDIYVEPVLKGVPTATVTELPEYVGEGKIEWKTFGGFGPTPDLEATLDTAYSFKCDQTLEEARESGYADWICDFYVKLDSELAPNEIFLGGNYGGYQWIGFHNGDITLGANEEIPLLQSVGNPWTYEMIVDQVGEFWCGVGNVGDSLKGATFTVTLRLVNPDDMNDIRNIESIEYTFE